ncbi:MAG: head-tail connector protein, partial [Rickettsiales bacterium]|nr:head-tail connector protein [Rickettsiales bacterium]
DLGGFGNSPVVMMSGLRSVLSTQALNPMDVWVALDAEGNVDTIFRRQLYTARNLVLQKSWTIPAHVTDKAKLAPDTEFEVLQVIAPRKDYNPDKRNNTNMPIQCCYILTDKQHLLQETGFEEMPLAFGRWAMRAGAMYGEGPAARALPDVLQLNAMQGAIMLAAEKSIDPALVIPNDGFLGGGILDTSAGAVNVRADPNGEVQTLETNGNLGITVELIQAKQQDVHRAFYIDQMQMVNDATMTATEVLDRRDERYRLMTPLVSRVQNELLGPLIERAFFIMLRGNHFLPLPAQLQGANIKISYVSPLARVQRAAEIQNINGYLAGVGQLAQLNPSILENIDFDATAKELHEMGSVPQSILKSPKAVQKERQARQQQQQVMQALEGAQMAAGAAKDAKAAEII